MLARLRERATSRDQLGLVRSDAQVRRQFLIEPDKAEMSPYGQAAR